MDEILKVEGPKRSFTLSKNQQKIERTTAKRKVAADEFRSTNGQIEWMLSEALKKAKRMPKKNASKESTHGTE